MVGISTIDAVSTTTLLSVNPAFLQEIKDSNPDYWESIHRIQIICHSPDDPNTVCRSLVKALDVLRDTVALQFSLEESYGYIVVGDRRDFDSSETPITEKAASSHAEHRTLYIKLSELAEVAEELQYRGVEFPTLLVLSERVSEFIEHLQRHERDEANLIEQTLSTLRSQQHNPG